MDRHLYEYESKNRPLKSICSTFPLKMENEKENSSFSGKMRRRIELPAEFYILLRSFHVYVCVCGHIEIRFFSIKGKLIQIIEMNSVHIFKNTKFNSIEYNENRLL